MSMPPALCAVCLQSRDADVDGWSAENAPTGSAPHRAGNLVWTPPRYSAVTNSRPMPWLSP